MKELHNIYKEISYKVYTSNGNSPHKLEELIQLDKEFSITLKNLKLSIDRHIDGGYFFLERLPCGRYIKSYRINEICKRTIDVLRPTMDSRILTILESEPRILYTEFYRWLTTQHSSMMSSVIDEFWHQFMTFSYEYKSWCFDNFGRFIHHIPTPVYEKNETVPQDILMDYAKFFKAYISQYELNKNVLLYSLPLRLYIHEDKSLSDVFEILKQLAAASLDAEITKGEQLDKKTIEFKNNTLQHLHKHGYAVLPKMPQSEFCNLMEDIGTIINTSDIKINALSNRKFNHHEALDLHTDTPLADYAAWYCITQDKVAGETEILDGFTLLDEIPSSLISVLCNTEIKFPIYKSHDVKKHPILTLKNNEYKQIYYTSWLKNKNYSKEQKDAITAFEIQVSNATPINIKLEPNETLIINNKRMLHGRKKIAADSSRYLYRVHIKQNDVATV